MQSVQPAQSGQATLPAQPPQITQPAPATQPTQPSSGSQPTQPAPIAQQIQAAAQPATAATPTPAQQLDASRTSQQASESTRPLHHLMLPKLLDAPVLIFVVLVGLIWF